MGVILQEKDSILALFKIRGNNIKKCRRKNCIIAEFINLENLRIRMSFFNFWNKIMSNFWCLNNTVLFFYHFPTWFVLSTQKRSNFSIKVFWANFICFVGYCNLWPSCWKFKIQRNHLKTSRAVCYRRWVVLFNIKINTKFSYCSTFQLFNFVFLWWFTHVKFENYVWAMSP